MTIDGKEAMNMKSFDFLGYEFRPRPCRSKEGVHFIGFTPAISPKAVKKINEAMRKWKIQKWVESTVKEMAKSINPILRGWINYFGAYNRSRLYRVFVKLNDRIIRWSMNKYKGMGKKRAIIWVRKLREKDRKLFAHWNIAHT